MILLSFFFFSKCVSYLYCFLQKFASSNKLLIIFFCSIQPRIIVAIWILDVVAISLDCWLNKMYLYFSRELCSFKICCDYAGAVKYKQSPKTQSKQTNWTRTFTAHYLSRYLGRIIFYLKTKNDFIGFISYVFSKGNLSNQFVFLSVQTKYQLTNHKKNGYLRNLEEFFFDKFEY